LAFMSWPRCRRRRGLSENPDSSTFLRTLPCIWIPTCSCTNITARQAILWNASGGWSLLPVFVSSGFLQASIVRRSWNAAAPRIKGHACDIASAGTLGRCAV
jgi:hypothetical protein